MPLKSSASCACIVKRFQRVIDAMVRLKAVRKTHTSLIRRISDARGLRQPGDFPAIGQNGKDDVRLQQLKRERKQVGSKSGSVLRASKRRLT